MKHPEISVIIPVYNGAKTLNACLESILNQTYQNYEVIVVDNHSTDKTISIIHQFARNNRKLRSIFEPKKGRGSARNAGLKSARGAIILTTDCDCVVPRNWIKMLIKPIIQERESAVVGFEKDLSHNYWSQNIQRADWQFMKRNTFKKYINHVDTKNFAIKAGLIKKLMFDSNLESFDDLDLYLRLKEVAKIRFVPSCRVGHNHKNTFIKTVKMNFNRGYWTTRIAAKYKSQPEISAEPMLESVSLINFITFPFWITYQFLTTKPGEAYFLLVSELAWRAGIIWSILK